MDPFYRRGVAEVELGDFAAAVPDLERAVEEDPTYDFHRGIGLLAHAYAQTGKPEKAGKALSGSDEDFYEFGNLLQLRVIFAVAGASGGSAAVGAEDFG